MNSEKGLISVIKNFPGNLKGELISLPENITESIEEIRIRNGRRVTVEGTGFKYETGILCTREYIDTCLNIILDYSYYAYEQDLAKGFVTLPGGHRVGVCGKVVIERGKVRLIKEISSLNIRCCREVQGIAKDIGEEIVQGGQVLNVLIVSPPRCGKTTLLRDLVREISYRGFNVGVCDERGEIGGVYEGKPSFDLGNCTDIIDGCPKGQGMLMLLRGMSPHIIATDEIGNNEDTEAIKRALYAGVKVFTTIHASSYDELLKSPLNQLLEQGAFQRVLFLSNVPYQGRIHSVLRL